MTWQGERFDGTIGLYDQTSSPSWPQRPRPPEGAPNVLVIMVDDVGFGHFGCYGSAIATPNIDRLAAGGLRYSNFHTTALCSPTRSCLLTGRNSHTNALGNIAESASGYPGYNGMIPRSSGFVSRVLQQQGYATFMVGKWHLCSPVETSAAGPFHDWPLGRGFDRFYGFLGGETDQFDPDLVHDNHRVAKPDVEGYHLTDDLARAGLSYLRDLRSVDTTKPWFMYWSSGACHAPHQAPQEYLDRYRGKFDEGWDVARERTLQRQIEFGIMPEGTVLSQRPDVVTAWVDLTDDQRRLYARQMETFAAFLTHLDDAIGRLVDGVEALGELDNTVIMIMSDNGASAEGQFHGTFNENLMFNGIPASIEENLAHLDEWGGPNTFAHYAHGWALAGNTPFPKWKRVTYDGGIADPLVVHFPNGTDLPGTVRHQYTHAIDITPTILSLIGLDFPDHIDGIPQTEVAGRSFVESLQRPDAPEHRTLQYYEMYGNRAIYHDGWVAVSFHPMPSMPSDGAGDPRALELEMPWELYDLRSDRSQSTDVAAQHPDVVRRLEQLWFAEAGKYGVFPIHSRVKNGQTPRPDADRTDFTYWAGTSTIPNDAAPRTLQRPFTVRGEFTLTDNDDEGVVIAQGGKFGGWSVFVQDGRVHYEYNYLGLDRYHVASEPLAVGTHTVDLDVELSGEFDIAPALTALGMQGRGGRVTLVVDGGDPLVLDVTRMIPFNYSLTGEGLCCGFDSETPVSERYESPFPFTGEIAQVVLSVEGTVTPNPIKDAERARLVQ